MQDGLKEVEINMSDEDWNEFWNNIHVSGTIDEMLEYFRKHKETIIGKDPNIVDVRFNGYYEIEDVKGLRPETQKERVKRLEKEEKARRKKIADKKKKLAKMKKDVVKLEEELDGVV